jgi:hypothetical protein
MTGDEKIQRMASIIGFILPDVTLDIKTDALTFLSENKDHPNVNMRTLIMISKMRQFNPDGWKEMAQYMLNS